MPDGFDQPVGHRPVLDMIIESVVASLPLHPNLTQTVLTTAVQLSHQTVFCSDIAHARPGQSHLQISGIAEVLEPDGSPFAIDTSAGIHTTNHDDAFGNVTRM